MSKPTLLFVLGFVVIAVSTRGRRIFAILFASLVFGDPFGRNRVMSTCRERVTAQDAPHRKSKANEKASFCKCFNRIGRACRGKPTAGISFQGRKIFLIKAYKPNANVLHGLFVCAPSRADSISRATKAARSSRATSVLFLPPMASRALMTIRNPVRSSSRRGS